MTPRPARPMRGFTYIEVMLSVLILAILGIVSAKFAGNMIRFIQRLNTKMTSHESVRMKVYSQLERDLMDANQIDDAQPHAIQFRMDSYRLPNYSRTAVGASGVPNFQAPDDDVDASTVPATFDVQWRYGNDLDDDDDDDNNLVDVQYRYEYDEASKSIFLKKRFNVAVDATDWQSTTCLLKNVTRFDLTYFGSPNEIYGTGLVTNSEGIITAEEMPPNLGSSLFPTGAAPKASLQKRNYITAIRVVIGHDANGDGIADHTVETAISPPLLPYKRKLP